MIECLEEDVKMQRQRQVEADRKFALDEISKYWMNLGDYQADFDEKIVE